MRQTKRCMHNIPPGLAGKICTVRLISFRTFLYPTNISRFFICCARCRCSFHRLRKIKCWRTLIERKLSFSRYLPVSHFFGYIFSIISTFYSLFLSNRSFGFNFNSIRGQYRSVIYMKQSGRDTGIKKYEVFNLWKQFGSCREQTVFGRYRPGFRERIERRSRQVHTVVSAYVTVVTLMTDRREPSFRPIMSITGADRGFDGEANQCY